MNEIERHIENKVREAGSSFYWAMRLMDAKKRHAMYAVYAFCREVDDIADGPDAEDEKRRRLNNWRAEIDRVFDAEPETQIGTVLSTLLSEFHLNKSEFRAVIDGMEMDAPEQFRVSDMDELELYCDRVACAVGRISNSIFGIDPTLGDPLAKSLGEALQLTNILRDVKEDAERYHVYLPQDLLLQHGYMGDAHAINTLDQAVPKTCEQLAALAMQQYETAQTFLSKIERNQSRAPRVMMAVYKGLFNKLLARGWNNLDRPVSLTKPEKIYLVFKASFLG